MWAREVLLVMATLMSSIDSCHGTEVENQGHVNHLPRVKMDQDTQFVTTMIDREHPATPSLMIFHFFIGINNFIKK